jgi:putative ABC transport system permease protein
MLAGREFTAADGAASQKVAIVNEALARRYFGSVNNALGRYVGREKKTDTMIVGVVADSRHTNPRDRIVPTLVRPATQMGDMVGSPSGFAFYVRTSMPPDAAIGQIRQALHRDDPKLVVDPLRSMDAQLDDTLTTQRTIALLASSFGVIATLLAAIGLYGVLAFVTAQRTREIGVRLALGARPMALAALVLREVLVLIAISLAFALPASFLLTRLLRSELFNVSTADALTYGAAVAIVTIVAMLAAAIPAHRAASVDPMQALRAD